VWDEFPEGVGSRFDEEYRRSLREQVPVRFEELYEPLGRMLEIRVYPVPDGLAIYFSDVTAERLSEERLRQGQRLEAIGRVTAGVAHDFNNLLAVICGFAKLGQDTSVDEKTVHYFDQIDSAGHKAAERARRGRARRPRRGGLARGHGHRLRYPGSGEAAHLRPVLHDEATGNGNRPRPCDDLRDRFAERRIHRRRLDRRRRNHDDRRASRRAAEQPSGFGTAAGHVVEAVGCLRASSHAGTRARAGLLAAATAGL